MFEMMTTEILVEAEWVLLEYWTKGRMAVQTDKGGWSDFDVVAFHPHPDNPEIDRKSHLVIAEAKAYGTKDQVYVTTSKNVNVTLENIETLWTKPPEKNDPYLKFIHQVKVIDGSLLKLINNSVEVVTIQIVSNWMIDQDIKKNVEKKLAEKVKEVSIFKDKTVICIIETPLDVFARIMKGVREDSRGRRYGNPVLDLAREFNRYLNPSYIHQRSFSKKREFQKYTQGLLAKMFSFEEKSTQKS